MPPPAVGSRFSVDFGVENYRFSLINLHTFTHCNLIDRTNPTTLAPAPRVLSQLHTLQVLLQNRESVDFLSIFAAYRSIIWDDFHTHTHWRIILTWVYVGNACERVGCTHSIIPFLPTGNQIFLFTDLRGYLHETFFRPIYAPNPTKCSNLVGDDGWWSCLVWVLV